MPEGFFLLIRNGREIGAIRLIKIQQAQDFTGKSAYESYFQGDGSGSFLNSSVIKRSGEIDIRSLRGTIHPLVWQPGQNKLWVGSWWFECSSPSLISMAGHPSSKGTGYEFAATSAREITDIDISDRRLRWFRSDPNTRVSLSVSDLPK